MTKLKFYFYSPVSFEKWDFRTPDTTGIGGSETSHIEMAWRLARRGHEVISYTTIPADCPPEHDGVKWRDIKDADFSQPGIWILYRCPEVLDNFQKEHPEQIIWLMCQDVQYDAFNEQRIAKTDKVLPISPSHAEYLLHVFPYMTDKLWITSNGIRGDLIRELEADKNQVRFPHRIVYASSPDRGLVPLLKIFRKAKEFVSDLELDIYYGFNNIDKLSKIYRSFKKMKAEVMRLADFPGIHLRGRANQRELYRALFSAGLWVYPTDFTETSCINCMEAQALGAIPITRPLWALKDNIAHGIFIEGSPRFDPLVSARYVGEIIRACNTDLQERIRPDMMRNARMRFNWERWVDQWEMNLLGIVGNIGGQFSFQHKYAFGRILNIGCDEDASGFLHRGAVNLDVTISSPLTNSTNPAHVIWDARDALPDCLGKFDSVILGDILEHLNPQDGVQALKNASRVLLPQGRIIVTVPDDAERSPQEQHACATGKETYAPGVNALHHRPISKEALLKQITSSGLECETYQELDYGFATGHAVVARRM